MDQIFMIEVLVLKTILKVVPPEKDEYEIRLEAEERKREAEALAAAEAALKGKKRKPPKPKKGKKGKAPPIPSEQEIKFTESCSLQINCLPLFDFYVAHDNFIEPPPPPPPGKKGKGKQKKPNKNKKGKGVAKLILPSEPLPEPPYLGVGNSIVFLSRPSNLEEELRKAPMYISVWNRDQQMKCVGCCVVHWPESFFECLQRAADMNPMELDQGEFRITAKPTITTNTVQLTRSLQCEGDLTPSGEIEFYVRLTCMGNKVTSYFVKLPEMERLPGRKYVTDDLKSIDVEVVRHWEGTNIEEVPSVAYLFSVPSIFKNPLRPVEELKIYEEFVAPYTASELEILAMGYPQSTCTDLVCPKTKDHLSNQNELFDDESVNKKKDRGPCGKFDCKSKNTPAYVCNEGAYKTCRKPCKLLTMNRNFDEF